VTWAVGGKQAELNSLLKTKIQGVRCEVRASGSLRCCEQ